WKTMYYSLEKELKEIQITSDAFQSSSKELEEELERELQALEAQNNKLRSQNQSLLQELDILTEKRRTASLESNYTIGSLQKELETLRDGYGKMQRKAVDLEMENEELENFKRAAHCSMADMEGKSNEAREWKEKFERETNKCNRMKEEMQRLKDELRDLENELSVTRS
ncbi:hypothetical protein K493DRAFT_155238, partial [Basidiobolus meristosporus CBS 931.73]